MLATRLLLRQGRLALPTLGWHGRAALAPGRTHLAPLALPGWKRLEHTQAEPSSGTTDHVPATLSLPPAIQLRPYQEECIQECLAAIESGVTRIGVSSPTGSGKTTIFTHLIDRIPSRGLEGTRVIVIVNSIELALQAANAIHAAFPDKSVEIEQGSKFKATGLADVTVATYQTLHRSRERLEKFGPRTVKAVVVDEAHHAAAPSYLNVLSYFDPKISEGEAESTADIQDRIPIVGFSATFSRHDGLALGKVFDRIVFHKDFLEMIGEKWLCPIRFTSIKADIDLSNVKLSNLNSDFQTASLASVVNTPVVNKLVLKAWIDRAARERRSTLIFAVNIQHVKDLTQTFREAGVDARYLHGGTPLAERRQLLQDFRSSNFPVLVNCAILTEGADVPSIDCVLLARPTKSRNLFSQMIGRGLRLSPQTGKKDCLILDIVGNIEKGVVCTPTLFGLDADDIIEDESVESLQERGELAAGTPTLEEDGSAKELSDPTKLVYVDYENPFELQRAMQARSHIVETMSPNAWVSCGGDTYVLDVPRFGFVKVERAVQTGEADNLNSPEWTAHFTPINIDADEAIAAGRYGFRSRSPYRRPRHMLDAAHLENAIRGSDLYVKKQVLHGSPQLFSMLNRWAKWRSDKASKKQSEQVAKRLGLSKMAKNSDEKRMQLDGLTKGQAAVILTRIFHGAKNRWKQDAKASNRLLKRNERELARKERETVKVGPLPSQDV